MPSKDPIRRFADIIENIVLIEEFSKGMDFKRFQEDPMARNAIERCLERISEAGKKLGGVAEQLCPDVPWHSVRGIGNFLRHEYDGIDPERVWATIEDDLAPLKAAAQRAVDLLSREGKLGPDLG